VSQYEVFTTKLSRYVGTPVRFGGCRTSKTFQYTVPQGLTFCTPIHVRTVVLMCKSPLTFFLSPVCGGEGRVRGCDTG